jgi:predicted nucleic acid-binding Zn ribbon protein
MRYRVPCECGDVVSVAEEAAGTTAVCYCGRTVQVPSLRELRRLSGAREPAPSPEMAVEALLLAGELPEERHCVLCGTATDGTVHCHTECERARIEDGRPPLWARVLAFLTFGWIGVLVVSGMPRQETEWGKDRIFDLPLRVCDGCRPRLTTARALKDALGQVPLYRRLLKKFPAAKVSLLGA